MVGWARFGLGFVLALVAGRAAAQEPVEEIPPTSERSTPEAEEREPRDLWIPFGLTGGWLGNGDVHAFVIGGEVSALWAEPDHDANLFQTPRDGSFAFGVVLDAVWVSNPSHFRSMLGAEVLAFFGEGYNAGLEVGATFHSRGDVVGFRARGWFTFWWPSLYVGLDYHERVAAEVGLLIKLPVRI